MRALWDEANALHRSLPDGAFRVVANAITLGDRAALMFRNAGRNQQFIVARCRSPNRSVRGSRISTPIECNKLLARSALHKRCGGYAKIAGCLRANVSPFQVSSWRTDFVSVEFGDARMLSLRLRCRVYESPLVRAR